MPRDPQDASPEHRTSIRFAVLELAATRTGTDEAEFLSALRRIVGHGRSRAEELWDSYRGGGTDARARLFARYAE
jgi:hypothetical protein